MSFVFDTPALGTGGLGPVLGLSIGTAMTLFGGLTWRLTGGAMRGRGVRTRRSVRMKGADRKGRAGRMIGPGLCARFTGALAMTTGDFGRCIPAARPVSAAAKFPNIAARQMAAVRTLHDDIIRASPRAAPSPRQRITKPDRSLSGTVNSCSDTCHAGQNYPGSYCLPAAAHGQLGHIAESITVPAEMLRKMRGMAVTAT